MHWNGLADLVFPTVQYLSHCCMSPLACHTPFYLARAGGCKSKTWMEGLRFLEIAPLLVCLDQVASGSQHHVNCSGVCRIARAGRMMRRTCCDKGSDYRRRTDDPGRPDLLRDDSNHHFRVSSSFE
jgi:hypothetical protein